MITSLRTIVWFSCGAASAVAAKLAVEQGVEGLSVVHCDTLESEHPDNRRFLLDVQSWIGRPIESIRSQKYSDIDDVFVRARYMAGIAGARCTTELKKKPREDYQRPSDTHVFGYTVEEIKRADKFEDNNPTLSCRWLLIEYNYTKEMCLDRLADAGIALPAMYALGFEHNNCIGCVKSASAGYWNRTRRLFPDVFERRAQQSRAIGARLVKIKGVRAFLDELPEDAYAPDDAIDCGPTCQAPDFRSEGEEP